MFKWCLNNDLAMKVADVLRLVEEFTEYEPLFQFVSSSYRNGDYVRFKRKMTYSQAQLMAQLAFGVAAYDAYGSTGLVELDGVLTPCVAAAVREKTKGKKFVAKVPLWHSRSIIDKCKRLLKIVKAQKQPVKAPKWRAYALQSIRLQGKPISEEAKIIHVNVKKPEKKKERTLTYAQVEAQAKMLARIYARDRERWNARERERRRLRGY